MQFLMVKQLLFRVLWSTLNVRVHSGDSIAVYPPQTLSDEEINTLEDYTIKLAKGLNIVGLINIQFVIAHDVCMY